MRAGSSEAVKVASTAAAAPRDRRRQEIQFCRSRAERKIRLERYVEAWTDGVGDMTVHIEHRFDLFAIYASADASWVKGYLLPALGLPASRVTSVERFDLGETRLDEFQRAVLDSRLTLVVLSPAFLGDPWAGRAQQLAAHLGVEERRNRLIPILLRPCELPLDLLFRVRLDYTQEADWAGETARLQALLERPSAPVAEDVPCPYPGLAPYTEAEAGSFCGRDREIRELVRRIARSLFVIGPSGSGKSSLVFAGLVPELYRREPGVWLVRSLRPGAEPLAALQSALEWTSGRRHPWDDPGAVVSELLARHPPARRLLLVIDQLEEALGQAPAPDREQFLATVRAVRQARDCVVVLTLRADFYPELMHSELWPVADAERLEVVPLRGAELREAITQPALQQRVYLEPALVERLVADAAREPGALPLLQETLRQLWGERQQRLLTVMAYETLGRDDVSGMAVALATWADASLVELSPEQQAIARRVFLRLVHLGEGRDDTRRQQPVGALRVAGEDDAALDETLHHLTDRRLLTRSGPLGEEDATVDLAHEALIAGWPTLRRWVAEGRASELLRRRIEGDAEEWRRSGRDRSRLYRGRQLKNFREWRANHPHEPSASVLAFLAAGRRLNATIKTVAVLLVAALAFGAGRVAVPVLRELELRRAASAASPMTPFSAGPAVLGGLGLTGPRARQRRSLAAFSIDRHEVTNGQYRLCIRANRCSRPLEPDEFPGYEQVGRDLPVVYLTSYQAADFCRWLGRRLPTGAEWERAARGTEGRPWPWGAAEPTPAHVNVIFDNPKTVALASVYDQRFVAGVSLEGVAGLVGNAWEWTSTPGTCAKTPYDCRSPWNGRDKVDTLELRGSGFTGGVDPVTFADPREPTEPDPGLGFRCARSG
jgi:formylglycine-generating enzyme required for sulfatase activity